MVAVQEEVEVAITARLNRQVGSSMEMTYRNTSAECVTFDPLVLGSDGVNVDVHDFESLGQPIATITLNGGAERVVFFKLRVGTQTPVARNERPC